MTSPSTTPVKIDEFPLPTGSLGRQIVITGVMMLLSSRRSFIDIGSPVYDYLLVGQPTAIKTTRIMQDGLFIFLFGVHSLELPIFAYMKLRKHGVPFFSVLWWKWMVACFIGGVFTFKHFDELVAKKTTDKAKKA